MGHVFVGAAAGMGSGTLPVEYHGDAASGREHSDRDMAMAIKSAMLGRYDETRPEFCWATTLLS